MTVRAPVTLGRCCACRGPRRARNIVMLDVKAMVPGRGWGCVACDLPCDGAVAVVCDDCVAVERPPVDACLGYPTDHGRVPIAELVGEHEHRAGVHEEIEEAR